MLQTLRSVPSLLPLQSEQLSPAQRVETLAGCNTTPAIGAAAPTHATPTSGATPHAATPAMPIRTAFDSCATPPSVAAPIHASAEAPSPTISAEKQALVAFQALLQQHVQRGSPAKWSFEADFALLVQVWQNGLRGQGKRPRVKGRSREKSEERLEHLQAVLPSSTFSLHATDEAERDMLLHMVERLGTSAGRKELIAELVAEQHAVDARTDSLDFAAELQQHYSRSEVQALIAALDTWHAQSCERSQDWTREEDLELIAKLQRCHAPGSTLLQKDITVSTHAPDDGCKNRLHKLRRHLPPNLSCFLSSRGDQAVTHRLCDRVVSKLATAPRAEHYSASSRAHARALEELAVAQFRAECADTQLPAQVSKQTRCVSRSRLLQVWVPSPSAQ